MPIAPTSTEVGARALRSLNGKPARRRFPMTCFPGPVTLPDAPSFVAWPTNWRDAHLARIHKKRQDCSISYKICFFAPAPVRPRIGFTPRTDRAHDRQKAPVTGKKKNYPGFWRFGPGGLQNAGD